MVAVFVNGGHIDNCGCIDIGAVLLMVAVLQFGPYCDGGCIWYLWLYCNWWPYWNLGCIVMVAVLEFWPYW